MHAARRRIDPRYGGVRDAATYVGRGDTSFKTYIAPRLHPIVVGSERIFSFDEIDRVLQDMAGPTGDQPLVDTGRQPQPTDPAPRRGRPRRHAVP